MERETRNILNFEPSDFEHHI